MNYKLVYEAIIKKALLCNRKKKQGIYYESHHIIPKCIGGLDTKSNLVLLTAKEHYICHHLLSKIYPDNISLFYAFWCMQIRVSSNQDRYKSSLINLESSKVKLSQIRSEQWKQNNPMLYRDVTGKANPFYNKTHSKETKALLSELAKKRSPPNCQIKKSVLIEGELFESIVSASIHHGVSTTTITRRIKSSNVIYNNYLFFNSKL